MLQCNFAPQELKSFPNFRPSTVPVPETAQSETPALDEVEEEPLNWTVVPQIFSG